MNFLERQPRDRIARTCVCCAGHALDAVSAILMPFVADRVFGWRPVRIDASWGLRSISEGMAYAACRTLLCRDCGLMFCDLRFSDAELAALYDGYREDVYCRLRDSYEPGYAARNAALNEPSTYVELVESFIRPLVVEHPRVLDWGGDTGKNTPFRRSAARIDIYDISNKPVLDGIRAVDRMTALRAGYDLIVCSMVLEHTPYPADLLADISKVMDPTSLLYVEVPFEAVMRTSGPITCDMKRYWHEHVNLFSKVSLFRLMEDCGLTIAAFEVSEVEIEGSAMHIFQLACRLVTGDQHELSSAEG